MPNKQHRFNPYEINGGNVCCIGGKGYVVVGADTRLSRGYNILSRNQSKVTQLTDKVLLATAGMHADRERLHTMLQFRLKEYKLEHGEDMGVSAIAQLLSNTLYHRRFFPYYTFNVLAGVDDSGQGLVYGYDAIGSTVEDGYGAAGSP
eukprot:UN02513